MKKFQYKFSIQGTPYGGDVEAEGETEEQAASKSVSELRRFFTARINNCFDAEGKIKEKELNDILEDGRFAAIPIVAYTNPDAQKSKK